MNSLEKEMEQNEVERDGTRLSQDNNWMADISLRSDGVPSDTDRDDHLTLTSEALNVSDDEWDQVCSLSRYLVQPAAVLRT